MNVLSCFDGMSCGQIALNDAGIPYDNYFASEIDLPGIRVTQHNYPNTKQLGDVTKIKASDLPQIDLLIGGSPCQGFSFAGKQLNFDDPRSSLFFEYVRLLKECKPKYFLLENVKMKQEHVDVISEALGVKPILINSARLTAHDRKRLYWTNIPNITQPEDKGLVLTDILITPYKQLYLKPDIAMRFIPTANYQLNINKSCVIGKLSKYQGDRVFDYRAKGSSLSASGGNNGAGGCNIIVDPQSKHLRRISPVECERLQGVPDNYSSIETDSNRYHMLGNGWTVPVIAHIFSNIENFKIYGW